VVYVKPPFEPHRKLEVGQFVDVRITAADAHDLWGAAE
jgi:ribosomal protein S12 methylthiotransferase